jgi:cytoskeletal protein CcmA (bactofilin family)
MALFSKDVPVAKPPVGRPADPAAPMTGTYFGPNVTIDGTISGSETTTVEGTIKGAINLTSDLRVGTKARIEASVHARNVIVEGKVTGDISADQRVELVASAAVEGNIKAPKIVVAEGAKFRGNVDMGSAKPHADEAAKTAATKAK